MNAPGSNLKINGERLWDSLMEMAKIGPGVKGGNRRLTLTDVDREGRDLFKSWAEKAGCKVAVDTMGNMFARREGTDPIAPAGDGRQPPRHAADRRQISTACSACSPAWRSCAR